MRQRPADSKWHDETTFSRDDTVRTPAVWYMRMPHGLELCVHRHIHYPGDWLLDCRTLDIDCRVLDSKDIAMAKREACLVVLGRIDALAVNALALRRMADGK